MNAVLRFRTGAVATAIAATIVVTAAAPGAPSGPAGAPPKVTSVTLGIRHRVFHDFGEKQTVVMKKRFQIADTDYSGEVVEFLPDFQIQLNPKRITSRSNAPNNPALRIVVREKGAPRDTVWAFLNSPPHFAAKSLLAFQVLEITFADHAAVRADTSAAAPDTARGHGR